MSLHPLVILYLYVSTFKHDLTYLAEVFDLTKIYIPNTVSGTCMGLAAILEGDVPAGIHIQALVKCKCYNCGKPYTELMYTGKQGYKYGTVYVLIYPVLA